MSRQLLYEQTYRSSSEHSGVRFYLAADPCVSLVQQANDPKNAFEFTPIHVAHPLKPSITICDLTETPKEVTNLQSGLDLSAGKVLATICLQDDVSVPKIKQWTSWLSDGIPADVIFVSNHSACLCLGYVEGQPSL